MKDGPSEIAILDLPSGFTVILESLLDAPLGVQDQAFYFDHPSKVIFGKKMGLSKCPQLQNSIFEEQS